MNMKLIRSGSCILLACCMTQMAAQPMPCPATPDTLISPAAVRQEKAAPSDVNRYIRGWNRIIPRHFKTQFAGAPDCYPWVWDGITENIMTSFGNGFSTLDFCPRYTTGSPHAVLTLKQTFRPWHIHIPQKRLVLSPFRTGLFLTTITGNEFGAISLQNIKMATIGFPRVSVRICLWVKAYNCARHNSVCPRVLNSIMN